MSAQMCICQPRCAWQAGIRVSTWTPLPVGAVGEPTHRAGACNRSRRRLPNYEPMQESEHVRAYLAATAELARAIEPKRLDAMARGLAAVRERRGRLFILGVGGGAGHASHVVNDFRKLCHLESYSPTDNVSELTARTNDDGWESSFSTWLEVSRLSERDALFVFSVGVGSREHNVSTNLVGAMEGRSGVEIKDARCGLGMRRVAGAAEEVVRCAQRDQLGRGQHGLEVAAHKERVVARHLGVGEAVALFSAQ
jgi:hypothetical protein